jgi:hypothetical protein
MRLTIILLFCAAAVACVAMGGRLQTSANELDRRTDRFYDELRRDGADGQSLREAEVLADAADDFNRAVDDRQAREDLDAEFDQLARAYHDARERYDDSRLDPEQRDRFRDVTTAYLEVEGALKYR